MTFGLSRLRHPTGKNPEFTRIHAGEDRETQTEPLAARFLSIQWANSSGAIFSSSSEASKLFSVPNALRKNSPSWSIKRRI